MNVIKRNGNIEEFNIKKINTVLKDANRQCRKADKINKIQIQEIVSSIEIICKELNKDVCVEDIQNMIENELCKYSTNLAKTFIRYRYKREVARNVSTDFLDIVKEKLMATNVQNQNANVDENSFGGRMGEARSEITRKYALTYLLSDMSKNNHLNNEIYIHDLDTYAIGQHNCLSIPFDDLLRDGFNTRQTDVRPAQSISTAFQLLAVIFQLQSLQQFGGVSATHLDWTLVPYVRKSFHKYYLEALNYFYDNVQVDKETLTIVNMESTIINDLSIESNLYCHDKAKQYAMDKTLKELNQSVEGMYHNLNTLQSRSGNQLPFTSINYGTCTLKEGRMVIKALLDGSIKGVGKFRKTPIFPCSIFQCMRGVNRNEGEPNYDLYKLALKSTSQRLYPNYVNVDWSGNEGYDINDPRTYMSTMGCRTYNGEDINGLGQLKDGRGNIAPVTIILPTLAMQSLKSKNPVDFFLRLLVKKLEEAKEMLIERYEWICSQDSSSAIFMYENNLMAGFDGETIESAMKHGTLAIGQLGLAETLQILIKCDHTTKDGMELAKKIEQLFRSSCNWFKGETSLNFGVYYTPAENLCYTSMSKFKQKYGVIENVSDKEFFTNSIHVPVWKEVTPFEKIDIESELTGYSNAGCITYVEVDSGVKNNLTALETLVNYALDKDIPYFAINVPNDTCLSCGYTDEFNDKCPECNSTDIQQLRRVTGYLTGNYTTAFNKGKQQEVELRYKHTKKVV